MYEKLIECITQGDYKEAMYELQEEYLHIGEKSPIDAAKLYVLEATLWECVGDSSAEYEAIARGMSCDRHNYELFYMLGLFYRDINLAQAYLCFQMALHYCDQGEDRNTIEDICSEIGGDPALSVRGTSFMILSYNDLEIMKKCIESIEKTVPAGSFEIVVVDNSSTEEGVRDFLKEKEESADYPFKLVLNTENMGFPKGCNIGTMACDGDNDILYLNNDAVLTELAWFWLKMGLYSDRNVGATGPLSNCASLQEIDPSAFEEVAGEKLEDMWHRKLGFERSFRIFDDYAKTRAIPMARPFVSRFRLTGFALLLSRDALNAVAPDLKVFDELFSPGYFEDDDLGIRLARAGFRQYVCNNSFVFHNGGSGFGSNDRALEEGREKFKEKWGFDIWGYSLPWFEAADDAVKIAKTKKGGVRILDFTCGFGSTGSYIKSKCREVYVAGVCRNSFEAGIAGKLVDDVAWGDANTIRLPWEERSFDIVLYEKNQVSIAQVMRYMVAGGLRYSDEDENKDETNLLEIVQSNADSGFDSEKLNNLLG